MRSQAAVIEKLSSQIWGVFFAMPFFHARTPGVEEGNERSQTFGTAPPLWLKEENGGCQIFYCRVN